MEEAYGETVISGPLHVSSVSNVPVAYDQSLATDEKKRVAITLKGASINNETLTYTVITGPSHGMLAGTAPGLIYTPDYDYNGYDSFTFRVNDGESDSEIATVNITVWPVVSVPVAYDKSVATNVNTPVTVKLMAADIDNNILTYSVVTGPSHGTLSGTAPNLSYTPDQDYQGTDSFAFNAYYGQVGSNTAMVNITVSPVSVPEGIYGDTIFLNSQFFGEKSKIIYNGQYQYDIEDTEKAYVWDYLCDGEINKRYFEKATLDLQDAISALKAIAGFSQDGIPSDADLNGDGKIGIEEVVYVLQVIADIRL